MKYFLIIIILTFTFVESKLKCPLEWIPLDSGNTLPPGSIKANGKGEFEEENYVVRAQFENGFKYAGRYVPQNMKAYFPYKQEDGNATALTTFEILTNPHNCKTSWTTSDAEYRKFTEDIAMHMIGRMQLEDLSWSCGQINGSMIFIAIDEFSEIISSNKGYQYLVSYQSGFKLDIDDVEMENDMDDLVPDFLGVDEFYNSGEATIQHSFSHSKIVYEFSSFTLVDKTISQSTSSVSSGFFKKTSTSESHTYEKTVTSTFTTETETNITVAREVTIPPHSFLRVCSIIKSVEDFKSNYCGTGKYTALGLESLEILDILYEEGIDEAFIDENDDVRVPVSGTLAASVAMDNKFIIIPIDSRAQDDCSNYGRNRKLF